jgi:LAO/AO transport system kinase
MSESDTNLFLVPLIEEFNKGDRKALAKIITLIESKAKNGAIKADQILAKLKPNSSDTIRIAVSGPPGVGKSTFINILGQKLIDKNYRIAILPIDPSSEISQGSILADKTRMKEIMANKNVYIRPSPSKGVLGGIALATKDLIYVVESFGFNFVIIETVGVGQLETMAHSLVDHFVVLMQPKTGDQLQAMKKGLLERADFILINKAEDKEMASAKIARAFLKKPKSKSTLEPIVILGSALHDIGIDEFLQKLLLRHQARTASGTLKENRHEQLKRIFYHSFDQLLLERVKDDPNIIKACQIALFDIADSDRPLLPTLRNLVEKICQGKIGDYH